MSLVCLVTGSSRGIGLAVAKSLAQQGHQVVLNSRREIEADVLAKFEDSALPVSSVVGNVSDFDDSQRMVDEVMERHGRLDVLINNAGITRDNLIVRMKAEDFDDVIKTNLYGTFNMSRHTAGKMLKQKSGLIINMSSIVGIIGNAGQANYAASKSGVIGLSKSLARELASRNIRVNVIAPGYIQTDMTEQLSDKVREKMLDSIPLKKLGTVDDICVAVNFLIESPYVTGQVIEVNGGMNM